MGALKYLITCVYLSCDEGLWKHGFGVGEQLCNVYGIIQQ